MNSLIFSRYYSPRDQWFIMKLNEGVKSWNKYIAGRKLADRWSVIMHYAKFHNKNFDNIDLAGVKFYFLSLKNVKMRKSNLNSTYFDTLCLINIDISQSTLTNAFINSLFYKNSNFSKTNIINGKLMGDKMIDVLFIDSNLIGSQLSINRTEKTNFSNCIFKRAKIVSDTYFYDCNFTNSDFNAANFVYTQTDRIGGNAKVRFFSCNFTNANLTGIAQLDNAAFTYSDMNGAKIERKWFNYLKTQGVKNFDKIRWQ